MSLSICLYAHTVGGGRFHAHFWQNKSQKSESGFTRFIIQQYWCGGNPIESCNMQTPSSIVDRGTLKKNNNKSTKRLLKALLGGGGGGGGGGGTVINRSATSSSKCLDSRAAHLSLFLSLSLSSLSLSLSPSLPVVYIISAGRLAPCSLLCCCYTHQRIARTAGTHSWQHNTGLNCCTVSRVPRGHFECTPTRLLLKRLQLAQTRRALSQVLRKVFTCARAAVIVVFFVMYEAATCLRVGAANDPPLGGRWWLFESTEYTVGWLGG